ncbi:MAG: MFS transporter [Dehalococcoidia bacterium]
MADQPDAARPPRRLAAIAQGFRALENRNFRIFWLGTVPAQLGDALSALAITWLTLRHTDSALAFSVVAAVQGIPFFILTPLGGVLADRWPMRNLIVAVRIVAAVLTAALGVLVSVDAITLWWIYAFGAITGVIATVGGPATAGFVEELAGPDQQDLANAAALLSTRDAALHIVGGVAGGALIARFGEAPCFYLAAIGILIHVWAVLAVDVKRLYLVQRRVVRGLFTSFKEGIAYAARTPDIAVLMVLGAALTLFGAQVIMLVPFMARHLLGVGPAGLGTMRAFEGAGALLGSVFLDFLGRGTRRLLFLSAVVITVALLGISLADRWPVFLALFAFYSFSSVVYSGTTYARLMAVTGAELQGRMMATFALVGGPSSFVGMGAGALADRIGLRRTAALLTGFCGLGIVVALLYARRRRAQMLPDMSDDPLLHAERRLVAGLRFASFPFNRAP